MAPDDSASAACLRGATSCARFAWGSRRSSERCASALRRRRPARSADDSSRCSGRCRDRYARLFRRDAARDRQRADAHPAADRNGAAVGGGRLSHDRSAARSGERRLLSQVQHPRRVGRRVARHARRLAAHRAIPSQRSQQRAVDRRSRVARTGGADCRRTIRGIRKSACRACSSSTVSSRAPIACGRRRV